MFSNFVHIFTTPPQRQAEGTDARLRIRRHDPDQEQRREKPKEEEKKLRFETYDNATVRVDSLKVFLENFLKSMEAKDQREKPGQLNKEGPPVNFGTPPALPEGPSAVAAGAYRTAAKTSPVLKTDFTPENPGNAEQALLGNEDVRMIYALLRDIEILHQRRIEYIYIERGETFLASLADAVKRALDS